MNDPVQNYQAFVGISYGLGTLAFLGTALWILWDRRRLRELIIALRK